MARIIDVGLIATIIIIAFPLETWRFVTLCVLTFALYGFVLWDAYVDGYMDAEEKHRTRIW